MKKPLLSPDLEYAVQYAIAKGACGLEVVSEEELSKSGRIIYRSIAGLVADGKAPPHDYNTIALMAVEVLGAPKELVRSYLQAMTSAVAGAEIKDILAKVRGKQLLVELITESSAMLGKGVYDAGLIQTIMTRDTGASDIEPMSDVMRHGFPAPPTGVPIKSLPLLTEKTGGLYGMWALSGEPGVGKTGVVWQIVLDVCQSIKGIYYDFENGLSVLGDRTRQIAGGDLERARHLVRNVYYRNSIRTLDADLAVVPPPAVIAVDSIQKLPGSVTHKRESLDRWVHRLEYLKKRGYHIIAVSEVPRSQYQQDAYIGAFKESGEVEYSADTGIQLLPERDGQYASVHIVKNRHRPHKGYVTMLERVDGWRFKEIGTSS